MRKRNLLLMCGLAVAMMFSAAPKAHAGVIVGVRVGAAVYVHPARAFVYGSPHVYVAPRPRAYRHVYVRHEYVRRGYARWRR